jgi:hypothetical protein
MNIFNEGENLSESALLRVPVRITVTSASVFERAENLVDALTGKPPVQRQQTS